MPKLVYSMQTSLDGYINRPDGTFEFVDPDEEVHRFHNEAGREIAVHLYGRRLYETMVYWETASGLPETEMEWARDYQRARKVIFSSTLESVVGNARLVREGAREEVERLKASDADGVLAVGGAGLAASVLDLVDVIEPVVYPVIVGGGTPFLPDGFATRLTLTRARTFASGVVALRYERAV